MTKITEKTLKRQLAQLRKDWRRWRTAQTDDPGWIERDLVCPVTRNAYRKGKPLTCGDPTCEGCLSTLYRADRMAEIEARVRELTAPTEIQPVQEALFA
ncbi:hypothetical protein [Sphaerisporangium sp. TRM90804]|uniref:hypothetical protein n=1 Tax=Sphaerisporangium sp. TRM90804 TaxID=3031113 RepID=UPI002447B7BD|nr:hypothetical protein [Sphaerisporangium sp. TRM90804]MDH2429337.1 hypothetical protein [Sphaerisporangium sp. TRM90804]